MSNLRGHGGARIGAGRKPKLEAQTIENIKRFSASTILKLFRDSATNPELKAEIATKIFLKSMPNVLDVNNREEIYTQIDVNLTGLDTESIRALIAQGRTNLIPERTA